MNTQQDEHIEYKKPPRKNLYVRIFLITFLICAVVFAGGYILFNKFLDSTPMGDSDGDFDGKYNVLIPGEGIFANEFKDSERVNVLLMGNTNEGLADTIMLASFDPETKKVDVISVPRDTYHKPAENSKANYKINSVMHDGPEALAQAVHEELAGIPINYYALVSYKGVEKIVDSIGGVPMDVPMHMKYTSKKQDLHIDIPKGEQVLDGEHAVQFLRFRSGYATADIGRIGAQQEFVKAAAKEALGLKLPKVARTVIKNVESDLSIRAMLYMAKTAKGMQSDGVSTFMLPGKPEMIHGGSYWKPAELPEIEQMLRDIYAPPAVPDPAETTESTESTEGTTKPALETN
jgi:LCP family protein required for cell wall assembly